MSTHNLIFMEECENISQSYYKILLLNQCMPNGLFYLNYLDRSISKRRGVWLLFVVTMFYKKFCIKCKQCISQLDAAFCDVRLIWVYTVYQHFFHGTCSHVLNVAGDRFSCGFTAQWTQNGLVEPERSQLAFFINLQRAVIGWSATLRGR